MHSIAFYPLVLLSLTSLVFAQNISATTIGVTYSTPASVSGSVMLSPEIIAAKVVSMDIPAVRLLDSNPEMIRAFANTNVALFLSVPNSQVPLFASNISIAMDWIHSHVEPFYRQTKISIISVGNDLISYSPNVSPAFLLLAMENVQKSLAHLSINEITVSTTFSFVNTITTAFPPSSAQFQQPTGEMIIKPILKFLERTRSSFLINIDPYNMYRSCFSLPIGFALFENCPFNYRDDVISGVRYRNLFELMTEAIFNSLAVMDQKNLAVVVAEVGWPSSGIVSSERDATLMHSEMFLKGLIDYLSQKDRVSEVYILILITHFN